MGTDHDGDAGVGVCQVAAGLEPGRERRVCIDDMLAHQRQPEQHLWCRHYLEDRSDDGNHGKWELAGKLTSCAPVSYPTSSTVTSQSCHISHFDITHK